ncbi:MAG: asparaginase, partial [Oleiphilaceae bacterium]|nr:asparaginase [Oleiphilaceae bacterium]
EFAIGTSLLPELLAEANIHASAFDLRELMRKDSLDLDEADRALIRHEITESEATRILVTHGTDTMTDTALALAGIEGKTVVLTGAMQPARMRRTDAVFNLGFAWAAVELLPVGVYLAMNGEVFEAGNVRKNRKAHRFERVSPTY